DEFAVLLISPTRTQCRQIVVALRDKGFENIHYVERQESMEPTLLEGLKLLLENKASNLGWRIVARALLPAAEFESLLKKTASDDNPPQFCEVIGDSAKRQALALLKVLRAVKDGKGQGSEAGIADFLNRVAVDAVGMATGQLREQIRSSAQG